MEDKEQREKEMAAAKEQGEKNRDILKGLVAEGKLPEPRALTRSERKKLDAAGHNILKIKRDDPRTLSQIKEDMADWILDNNYPGFDFALENNICLWFGEYVFAISYRDDLSAKNF